jgi:hypothetical protein
VEVVRRGSALRAIHLMCATDSFRRPGSGQESAAVAPFQRLGITVREPGQQLQEQSKSLLLNRPKSSPALRHLQALPIRQFEPLDTVSDRRS